MVRLAMRSAASTASLMARSAWSRSTMAPLRVPREAWQPKPSTRSAEASLPSAVRRFWLTTSPMRQLILVLPTSRAATILPLLATGVFASPLTGNSMTVMQNPFPKHEQYLLLLAYLEVLNFFYRRDRFRQFDDHLMRQPEIDRLDALAEQLLAAVKRGERLKRLRRIL